MGNPADSDSAIPPNLMRALRIRETGEVLGLASPVVMETITIPRPGHGQILLRVHACGVCHTEIDEIEGRSPPPCLPMTPGHQVVGTVMEEGPGCNQDLIGRRVGVAWIHSACGQCEFCRSGRENLCPDFVACGRDVPGGYADYMVADEHYVHLIPESISDAQATPLLCAGAVGFRALRLCQLENGESLGLTGFGASGHLVLQMARHLLPDSHIHVFARSKAERDFALSLGAHWAGETQAAPPHLLNAIIDTTPAWLPVLCALEHLAPGGRLVINAIRKESADQRLLQTLSYERQLWMEKSIQSVANVTREDVAQCLRLAVEIPLRPKVSEYPLEQAVTALKELKQGHIRGAKVLMC